MKDFAASFYKSKQWQDCRAAYLKSVGGLCERCLARGLYVPGVIVHHKRHITPETIDDPTVTLDFGNLELLCRDCHGDQHRGFERRWRIDESGRVEAMNDCPPSSQI